MSVTSTAASGTQNLTSTILQQLLAGSNAQSTSGLSPTVLKQVLDGAGASQPSAQAPADITQALGNLLSGSSASSKDDLAKLQAYFKDNPGNLTNLLGSLQGGAGTYGANGALSSSNSLLTALGLSGSSPTAPSSLINLLLGGQSQDPLLASLGNGDSAGASRFSMLG